MRTILDNYQHECDQIEGLKESLKIEIVSEQKFRTDIQAISA